MYKEEIVFLHWHLLLLYRTTFIYSSYKSWQGVWKKYIRILSISILIKSIINTEICIENWECFIVNKSLNMRAWHKHPSFFLLLSFPNAFFALFMVGNEKREPYSSITKLSIWNLEPQRFIHNLNPFYRKLTQLLFEAAELESQKLHLTISKIIIKGKLCWHMLLELLEDIFQIF